MGTRIMSTKREYFVYRLFDAADRLLYVGCTNRPYLRWAEHRTERPWMAQRAVRFHMQGPFTRKMARALERQAQKFEHPLFGLTPAKQSHIMRAHHWQRARAEELMESGRGFQSAWRTALAEARLRFPAGPISYSDLSQPWDMAS